MDWFQSRFHGGRYVLNIFMKWAIEGRHFLFLSKLPENYFVFSVFYGPHQCIKSSRLPFLDPMKIRIFARPSRSADPLLGSQNISENSSDCSRGSLTEARLVKSVTYPIKCDAGPWMIFFTSFFWCEWVVLIWKLDQSGGETEITASSRGFK